MIRIYYITAQNVRFFLTRSLFGLIWKDCPFPVELLLVGVLVLPALSKLLSTLALKIPAKEQIIIIIIIPIALT